MKNLADDLLDGLVDTPGTTSINPNDKTNYWLIAVVLLAIAWLLLLLVSVVKYYLRRGF